MIERLNFYDVYGYLLPGSVFVALLWLPFAIGNETLLKLDWSSALLVLVLAYIAGHLIQGLALHALPSTKKDKGNRHPSDFLLDSDDTTLSPEIRNTTIFRISVKFGLDVGNAGRLQDASLVSKRRSDAFFMCRRALIQNGLSSYAEQFEGMYALMRGVCAACIFGVAYYLGLLIRYVTRDLLNVAVPSTFSAVPAVLALLLLFFAVLAIRPARRKKRVQVSLFWLVPALLLVAAALIPSRASVSPAPSFLLAMSMTLLFVSLRCYVAYDEYSRLFAATVYRDFCALKS